MEKIHSFIQSLVPRKATSSLAFKTYPTLRDHPLHTAEMWLEGKRTDDGAEGLWRINNKLYDFTSFIEQHPGGQDWLKLTKGTDITEAFECHHISTYPEELLPKFFIREAASSRNSPFSLHDDGFYRTLKSKVREIVPTLPNGPVNKNKLTTDLLFMAYILTASLTAYFGSFFLAIVAGVLLSTLTIAAHNFFHQKDNFRMYYFDFSLMSSRSWRITHAYSHHIYANTVYDIEMIFTEPWLQYLPIEKHFFWRYISVLYSPIVFALSLFNFYIHMICQVYLDKGKSFQFTCFLPFTVLALMYYISPQSPMKIVFLFILVIISAGFHFGIVGVSAAHHHPDIFHDGDTPRKRSDLDWGLHQIDAVMDRTDINNSDFLVLTNFGDHCLHHLFPTIDHGQLKYLYPVFGEVCKQFGVQHRLTTQLQLVIGQYQQLARVEVNKKSPNFKS